MLKVIYFTIFILILFFIIRFPVFATSSGDVVINELMWMGSELSSSDEWIELKNMTENPIDLTGWNLTQTTDLEKLLEIDFTGKVIPAHGYLLVSNYDENNEKSILAVKPEIVDTSVSLVNDALLIKLYSGSWNIDGFLIDTAGDGKIPFTGENLVTGKASMERNLVPDDGQQKENWHTATISKGFDTGVSEMGTPGFENSPDPIPNQAPVGKLNFTKSVLVGENVTIDASESTDSDGEILSYSWDFGDGSDSETSDATTSHVYIQSGTYRIALTVMDDDQTTDETTGTITVTPKVYTDALQISEVLPNPGISTDWDGDGTANYKDEWIELFNSGKESVDLAGWTLDDQEGGSIPYTFPTDTVVKPLSYAVFYHKNTGITLNNDADTVRLIDPNKDVKDFISYKNIRKGMTYARDQKNSWTETETPTFGKVNVITVSSVEDTDKTSKNDTEEDEDEGNQKNKDNSSKKDTGIIKTYTIKVGKKLVLNSKIKITAILTATPDILGSRIIYVEDSTGGIKIKLPEGDYSVFALGDELTITGILKEAYKEMYLNVLKSEDIQIKKHGKNKQGAVVTTGSVNEFSEGRLIIVNGKVVKTEGNTFFLNDGSGEVKAYIKSSTSIDKPYMRINYYAEIQGVVSQYKDEYRILPRYQEDLMVSKEPIKKGSVLGVKTLPETGNSGLFWGMILIFFGIVLRRISKAF